MSEYSPLLFRLFERKSFVYLVLIGALTVGATGLFMELEQKNNNLGTETIKRLEFIISQQKFQQYRLNKIEQTLFEQKLFSEGYLVDIRERKRALDEGEPELYRADKLERKIYYLERQIEKLVEFNESSKHNLEVQTAK